MGVRVRWRRWLVIIALALAFPAVLYLAFLGVLGFFLSHGGY
ncbi:MAG TPA: hypothetical protein VJ850_02145 [Candidatus Limnocylindrales bacterium]|nr:hypothetical protein [Candidatus Limnocylindrales bacterium]